MVGITRSKGICSIGFDFLKLPPPACPALLLSTFLAGIMTLGGANSKGRPWALMIGVYAMVMFKCYDLHQV